MRGRWTGLIVCTALAMLGGAPATQAQAQAPGAAPPAVGVAKVGKHPVVETEQFIGRVQAVARVDIQARVTAFIEEVVFGEGTEVRKGDVLYRLERPPFAADVDAKQGAVATIQAQLQNANLTLQRAQTLLNTPAGQQSTVDAAKANQGNLQGQLLTAQAQLKTSQINLGYAEILSPVDGKIGRTALTAGNVVQPASGTLATVVGQDPMYVVFPVSVRMSLELRDRYANKGGFNAVKIKIVLPDGRTYGESGKLTFVDNTIAANTDTITLRGTISNPPIGELGGAAKIRELVDGEFVTVLARRRRAGRARGGAARRRPDRPERRLRLRPRRRQQGRAAEHQARAVDADRSLRPVRTAGRPERDRRRPAAGARRPAGVAGPGGPDPGRRGQEGCSMTPAARFTRRTCA